MIIPASLEELATYVEKFLKKIVPLVISSIVSPIVEVLVLSLAVLLIIGPIITIISDGLAFGISTIFDFNTIIGGAVYCALFPVLVVFGMHWPLIPIIVNDLTVNGFSMMNAFSSVLMMGIAGATCSIALKTKYQTNLRACLNFISNFFVGVFRWIFCFKFEVLAG